VDGRPFLDFVLAYLRAQGVRRVVLALGFRAGEVLSRLTPLRGLTVRAVREQRPLGTGGAMRNALRRTRSPRLLVMNGDTFAPVSVRDLLAAHRTASARVTLAAVHRRDAGRYGRLSIARGGSVAGFEEKGGARPGWIYAGVGIVDRDVLSKIPAGRSASFERDVLPGLVGNGLIAVRERVPFLDIGTPASYRRAAAFLSARGAA